MTTFLLQMLKFVWRQRVAQFWPIWVLITGAAAIGTRWFVGHAANPIVARDKEAAIRRARSYPRSGGAVAVLTLVVLLLVGYIVLTLRWEDFANYDDSYYTLFKLRGQNIGPMIWRESGRFFPLGHQEFNLIGDFTGTVTGYHAVPLAQLLIVSCILLMLDGELSITGRGALLAFALILPSIVIGFTGLVFPERNVVFWLAWLVFFVKRFEQTQSTAWAVAAAVCAQTMIYYKEIASFLLLGFALGRLIMRCQNASQATWDYNRLRDKESRLDLCLIALGLIFFLYYAAAMIPHVNMQYAREERVPLATMFSYYFRVDLLAWLLAAVVIGRSYLILRRRVTLLPLWDGLALGGMIYFIAYLILGLTSIHYMAPVDFIAVLYVGRLAILSWQEMHLWHRAATLVLGLAIVLQGASLSAFTEFERKNMIHAKAEIAGVIAARYQTGPRSAQRLFFPFARVYALTEFAAYLVYRGVPVEGEGTNVESVHPNGVVIVSKAFAKDEPCVNYRSFICHAGSRPDPGELVIELPDDPESLAEINPYRMGGKLLLSYEPRPRIPGWLYPFVRSLSVASAPFLHEGLPDRWLQASVTVWR
jgi:hypothetical protein